jgi:hypothetical protein
MRNVQGRPSRSPEMRSVDDLRKRVEVFAREIARLAYRHRHPGCAEAEALEHAGDQWPQYFGQALDALAVLEALEEAERGRAQD